MNNEVFATKGGNIILVAANDEDREAIEFLKSLNPVDILYDGEVKKAEVTK